MEVSSIILDLGTRRRWVISFTKRFFRTLRRPGRVWGPPSLLWNGYGGYFLEGKAAGWVSHRAAMDAVEYEEISCPAGNRTSTVHPAVRSYTDWAILAPYLYKITISLHIYNIINGLLLLLLLLLQMSRVRAQADWNTGTALTEVPNLFTEKVETAMPTEAQLPLSLNCSICFRRRSRLRCRLKHRYLSHYSQGGP
jgi:hypothetical protein